MPAFLSPIPMPISPKLSSDIERRSTHSEFTAGNSLAWTALKTLQYR